jgi:hypothetical protein
VEYEYYKVKDILLEAPVTQNFKTFTEASRSDHSTVYSIISSKLNKQSTLDKYPKVFSGDYDICNCGTHYKGEQRQNDLINSSRKQSFFVN